MHNEDAGHWHHRKCMTSCLRSRLRKGNQYRAKTELERAGGTPEPQTITIGITDQTRKKKLPTEGCVGIATGKLVDNVGIVDPWAIVPGVRESMIALANDLSKATLLLFSGSGKGDCSSP